MRLERRCRNCEARRSVATRRCISPCPHSTISPVSALCTTASEGSSSTQLVRAPRPSFTSSLRSARGDRRAPSPAAAARAGTSCAWRGSCAVVSVSAGAPPGRACRAPTVSPALCPRRAFSVLAPIWLEHAGHARALAPSARCTTLGAVADHRAASTRASDEFAAMRRCDRSSAHCTMASPCRLHAKRVAAVWRRPAPRGAAPSAGAARRSRASPSRSSAPDESPPWPKWDSQDGRTPCRAGGSMSWLHIGPVDRHGRRAFPAS